MSTTSQRPTKGVRYAVERIEEDASRVLYRGFVHLPDADLPLSVTLALPDGTVRALLQGSRPDLEKMAAALIRSATKSALTAGVALPRKIVRWRG